MRIAAAITAVFLGLFLAANARAGMAPLDMLGMCLSRANVMAEIAYYRDFLIDKSILISGIKKSKDLTPKQKENMIYNINRTYIRTDLTRQQIYDIVFNNCMNPRQKV